MKYLATLLFVFLSLPVLEARAQYVFLDSNGDQQCTTADSLQQGENQIDVYFHTNQNRDGSAAVCATENEALNMISYEFILRSLGSGTITYGSYTNHMTSFTVSFGLHQGGGEYHTGFGAPFPLSMPPGLHRVGTLSVQVAGGAGLALVASTALGGGYWTSFGSACDGTEFNNTIRFGLDFQDACGTTFEGELGPSPTESFYVAQRGSVGSPIEGHAAMVAFRSCPNNDGGTVLPDNARLKVVIRDHQGRPLEGIPAGDICINLNGGTAAQEFSGIGADSIIANSTWNPAAQCPDVRCITADAPTDANGVTYITLAGSTPGSPGVATRDPNRKWGHYDSDVPVTVQGVRLQGRLSSDLFGQNGTYVFHVKSVDTAGGLGPQLNQGEVVSMQDFNAIANNIGVHNSLSYWRDVNFNGSIDGGDFNIVATHLNHDCDTPAP